MRTRTFIVVAGLLATLLVVAGGVFLYDHSRRDVIAKGVSVGGVDLGGLKTGAARTRLRHDLLGALNRPVVVRWHHKSFELSAQKARVAVDVNGAVDDALARSNHGSLVTRTFRNLTGGRVDENITPRITYSLAAVNGLVAKIKRSVNRPARSASVSFSASSLSPVRSRAGIALEGASLRARLQHLLSLPGGNRDVPALTRIIQPKVTTGQLAQKYPRVIVIDRAAFTLRLFKNLKEFKTYPVAIGRQGLETPAGLYDVQGKEVNPSWHVPNSAWAGSLAGQTIPPGPQDPLKARWIGFNGGAGMHGIDPSEYSSIGTAGSHGCVRMRIPDVIDLYDRVQVHDAVFVA